MGYLSLFRKGRSFVELRKIFRDRGVNLGERGFFVNLLIRNKGGDIRRKFVKEWSGIEINDDFKIVKGLNLFFKFVFNKRNG